MKLIRLIDANALMKRVCGKECGTHYNIDSCDLDDESTDTRCVFREYVTAAPTVDAEPVRHGRWINNVYCSECNRFPVDVSVSISNQELTKYFSRCPHCGAKMQREEDPK